MSKTSKVTSLQRKVSMTLLMGIAVFVLLSFVILHAVIAPTFNELEMSAARTDLIRAEQAILNDIENLEAITRDWALWDDIYEYLVGRNPAFAESNLERPTLTNLGLDMMALYRADQSLDWGRMIVRNEDHALGELGILDPASAEFQQLTAPENNNERLAGLIATAFGPMLISSRPILRSDQTGPAAGTLVLGQFLDSTRIERLRERTEVLVHWHSVDDFGESHEEADSAAVFSGVVTNISNDDSVSSFKLILDIFGEQLLVLGTKSPRNISALGSQTINAGLLFFGVAALLLTTVVGLLLRGTILKPIEKLATHIDRVGKSGDLTRNLNMGRDDEIGALASQFDSLTSAVHDARQALLDQSFKAGKADTAAEVLHNIRNAMTPITNGVDRLAKSCAVGETLRVAEVTAELADPNCSPERAAKLLQYVDAAFQRLAEVGQSAADDLKLVSAQARQIEGILSDQERFANVAPVAEDIPVADVLSEAAHVIPKDSESDVGVELASDLDRFSVRGHRIGLLQVMGNLILNAYESIQRDRKESGEISMSASADVLNEKPMVRVTIRDNGLGFNGDVGKKIFERGFTSKAYGQSKGLGLHWCANAVSSMGGRILAESSGAGKGAEFHVLLPATQRA